MKIILASKSKSRKQLLTDLKIPFDVVVSNADETPNSSLPFGDQLKEIALRKALNVLKKTKDDGKRIILAADQNIVFNNKMFGKPKSIEEAKTLIKSMEGHTVYAYTGNAFLLASGETIIKCINNYDIANIFVKEVTDIVLDDYLKNYNPLSMCGGISTLDTPFVELTDGLLSTAYGITIEYLAQLNNAF